VAAATKVSRPPSYWEWLTGRGLTRRAGWRKFADRWLLAHALVGVAMALLTPATLEKAAQTVLLPLSGVFVGMSFAWIGNAQAALQSDEMEEFARYGPGGLENYVYTFQSAILAILVTLAAWAIAALGIIDRPCVWGCPKWGYTATSGLLYALASLTLRECWHVVMGAQMLLFVQRQVRAIRKEQDVADPPSVAD
jgi:hypothetical protein